jgi:hypothetical protein
MSGGCQPRVRTGRLVCAILALFVVGSLGCPAGRGAWSPLLFSFWSFLGSGLFAGFSARAASCAGGVLLPLWPFFGLRSCGRVGLSRPSLWRLLPVVGCARSAAPRSRLLLPRCPGWLRPRVALSVSLFVPGAGSRPGAGLGVCCGLFSCCSGLRAGLFPGRRRGRRSLVGLSVLWRLGLRRLPLRLLRLPGLWCPRGVRWLLGRLGRSGAVRRWCCRRRAPFGRPRPGPGSLCVPVARSRSRRCPRRPGWSPRLLRSWRPARACRVAAPARFFLTALVFFGGVLCFLLLFFPPLVWPGRPFSVGACARFCCAPPPARSQVPLWSPSFRRPLARPGSAPAGRAVCASVCLSSASVAACGRSLFPALGLPRPVGPGASVAPGLRLVAWSPSRVCSAPSVFPGDLRSSPCRSWWVPRLACPLGASRPLRGRRALPWSPGRRLLRVGSLCVCPRRRARRRCVLCCVGSVWRRSRSVCPPRSCPGALGRRVRPRRRVRLFRLLPLPARCRACPVVALGSPGLRVVVRDRALRWPGFACPRILGRSWPPCPARLAWWVVVRLLGRRCAVLGMGAGAFSASFPRPVVRFSSIGRS